MWSEEATNSSAFLHYLFLLSGRNGHKQEHKASFIVR